MNQMNQMNQITAATAATPSGKKLLRPLDAKIGQGIQALASLLFQSPNAM